MSRCSTGSLLSRALQAASLRVPGALSRSHTSSPSALPSPAAIWAASAAVVLVSSRISSAASSLRITTWLGLGLGVGVGFGLGFGLGLGFGVGLE